MIATITMNPSIDQNFVVRSLVMDDANRALSVRRTAGGKGLNVSKVLRELGGPTRAYALAGGFVGDFWKHLVGELGIPFEASAVGGETRINTVLTDIGDRTQTRVSAPGPAVTGADLDGFLKKLLAVRPKPFLWALGGSLPKGAPASTYRSFVSALQKNGTPCILDADDEALRQGVKARPFCIKPNEFEMHRLIGKKLGTEAQYRTAAAALVRRGVGIVVVSLGAKGALVVSRDRSFRLPGVPVPVKSKVGAGDSLIGGLALGLWKKLDLGRAAALGIAASTSAVMRESPRLCRRSDIAPLLRKVRIEPY
ncbi:MAG TPA: 1-phosphofructokinase family hexose kinase [Candidatus Eisenbacteria bacterium]|nr:1-phosphofructokinase family hexose kinase [Candidatus Eisenbacteria bacterium]